MQRTIAIGAVVIGLVLVGAACQKKTTDSNQNLSAVTNTSTTTNTTVNHNTNTAVVTNTNTSTSTNTTPTTTTSDGSVSVTAPAKNDAIESPFSVEGQAPAGTVYVRVKNAGGSALFTEQTTSRNGAFKMNLTFEFTHTTSGTLEVFQKDSDDNEVNLVSVPVTFKIETSANSNTNTSTTLNTNVNSSYSY